MNSVSTESGKGHKVWFKSLLIGVLLVLSPVIFVCAVVVLLVLFVLGQDWYEVTVRDRVKVEMKEAGFSTPTTVEAAKLSNQPTTVSTSPNGNWTITAHWIDGYGYGWEIKNKEGHIYYSQERIYEKNQLLPNRVSALWSPDGQYVALGTYWAYHMDGSIDQDRGVNEDVDVYRLGEKPPKDGLSIRPSEDTILKVQDRGPNSTGPLQSRIEALRWINNSDLVVVVYLERFVDKSNMEVLAAAHETLRFEGDSFEVIETKGDFYESFLGPWG
jgi:hypothetical protein